MRGMQDDTIRVRSMRVSDAPAVAALIRAAFAAQPVPLDPPASALDVTAEAVATHLGRAGGAVAEAGAGLLGCVLWERREDDLYVSRVAVDTAARRLGIARALMVAADDAARRGGVRRLVLGTRLALANNRRLFAACGYREVAVHAHPGYAAPTWVEMEKLVGWAHPVASPPLAPPAREGNRYGGPSWPLPQKEGETGRDAAST